MKKTLISLVILVCFSIAYGHDDHELDKSEIIDIAMSAAPANVSGEATIMSSDGSILRRGQLMDGLVCLVPLPMIM